MTKQYLILTALLLLTSCATISEIVHGPEDRRDEAAIQLTSKIQLPAESLRTPYLSKLDIKANYVTLSEIDSDLLAVLYISRYCPTCIEDLPKVNMAVKLINEGRYRDRIKLIAIAVNTTEEGVQQLRKKHQLIFPVSPDASAKNAIISGVKFNPHLLIIKNCGRENVSIISSKYHRTSDAKQLVNKLTSLLQK